MAVFKLFSISVLLATALSLAGCQAQDASESNPSAALDTTIETTKETSIESPIEMNEPLDIIKSTMDWREGRVNRLTEPYGWLSLVGYYLLDQGQHSLGRAESNDIVVPGGPDVWGQIILDGETVTFESADPERVLVDDRLDDRLDGRLDGQAQTSVEMLSSAFTDGEPTRIESDGVRVQLSRSGGAPSLRMRSPEAETRTQFAGLDYYEPDPAFRFEAEFIPHEQGNTMRVANVMGQIIDEDNPGIVRFEHAGQTFELETFLYGDELFIVFADRTSGNETYGLGRFLYADLPVDGKTFVDFNKAYNPPCAFSPYTTCSLPPQSNRMDTRITAGEKTYSGKPGMTEDTVVNPG